MDNQKFGSFAFLAMRKQLTGKLPLSDAMPAKLNQR
jgi:hypothetical protein